ncbi:MAG: DUF72 domain-containing protein [Vicinamibacterales bacterium]
MSDQPSLFDDPPAEPAGRDRDLDARLDARRRAAAAVAAALPLEVAFGTSSWAFPGWAGLVYPAGLSAARLGRDGLRHYARHPLLRTVGIDRSYYAPIPLDDLRAYADQLPDGFRACIKAPAVVTSRVVPAFGAGRGAAPPNPDFLSVGRLVDDLLVPLATGFAAHTGPIVLEFPPGRRDAAAPVGRFSEELDRFLEALPRQFHYAVEIRDRALLTPEYAAVLRRHGVAHTFNYWSAMPMPVAQAAVVGATAPFVVLRLLLKPGTWYEDQRERFTPFDRLVAPDEAMRGEVVALTARALKRGWKVYVLVNNKAEGSSPLTIDALAERLAAHWAASAAAPPA